MTFFKILAAIGLMVSGLLLGLTVLTAKKVDQVGDRLQAKLYHE
jgi:hypothetical protein